MTPYRARRSLALGLLLAGGMLASWLLPRSAAQPPSARDLTLRLMGNAYAKDHALVLRGVRTQVAGAVKPADRAMWAARLEGGLVVGYCPERGKLESVPLAKLGKITNIKMGGGRSAAEVVRQAVTPGCVVVQVSWDFGGPAPVKSTAVFGADGTPLFDTLLSMPVIQGPIFSPSHY